jgi:hypothetical protein
MYQNISFGKYVKFQIKKYERMWNKKRGKIETNILNCHKITL